MKIVQNESILIAYQGRLQVLLWGVKKVTHVIVVVLMSCFQFMKVNIFNINPKAVATFFILTKTICATAK